MSKIYNEKVKNRYLETYDNEGTRNTIKNIFIKSADTEETLNKDLYNFSIDDLIDVFKNINPKSNSVSLSAGRFLKQYISWCIRNGYRDDNLNPLNGVENDWFSQFVDKKLKIHYSYDEFIELLESMQNGQDQAFLFLIWEGIVGRSFSQLRELHFSNINWETHEVYVAERDVNIKVSEDCIKYLDKAYKQNTYFTYNDETKEHNEKPLLDSEYVFKNVLSPRSFSGQMVNPSVFYTRLNNLKAEFELEYLTPNAIKQSGMIYQATQLFEEYGVVAYEQFAEIGEKYDYNKLTANGVEYYNTNLMREFINEEKIKELYDIDVIIKKR